MPKISALPTGTTAAGTELIVADQGGVTVTLTSNQVAARAITALTGDVTASGAGSVAATWTGGTASKAVNEAPKTTIASAATVAIGAAATNAITISGTTAITAFDTIADGALRELTFAGALTLTYNAASLILPTAANITTAAGDVAYFRSLGSGNWRCVGYQRASGAALVAGGTGTVTNTGGNLTANSVVLGAGTADTKVVAGVTTDGTSVLNLGVAGTSVGKVALANATSGSLTLAPPTGALGTVTVTVPAATDTLVNLTGTQTLTNKTMTNAVVGTQTAGDNSTKAASTAYVDSKTIPFQVAISDLATALTTGTNNGYFDAPFACTLTEVIATVLTASTSGLPQFAVKKNGTTMLSTNITINASATSSLTATTPPVISVTSIAKGDRISFDIVAAGTGTKGAQISCLVTRP